VVGGIGDVVGCVLVAMGDGVLAVAVSVVVGSVESVDVLTGEVGDVLSEAVAGADTDTVADADNVAVGSHSGLDIPVAGTTASGMLLLS